MHNDTYSLRKFNYYPAKGKAGNAILTSTGQMETLQPDLRLLQTGIILLLL